MAITNPFQFLQQVRAEVSKVVWPTRREVMLTTVMVFILAAFGFLFAIASVTLAEGAKRVPAGQTALLSTLETPLAPVLAFIIFSEVPKHETIVGGSVVLMAILFSIDRKTR